MLSDRQASRFAGVALQIRGRILQRKHQCHWVKRGLTGYEKGSLFDLYSRGFSCNYY